MIASLMRRRGLMIAVVVAALLALAFFPALRYARAIAALLRIEDARQPHTFAKLVEYKVEEHATSVATPAGSVPARMYLPRGRSSAPAIVVLHGIHHLGIDEPRLVNFARVLAASGYIILTPELPALADYRIEPSSISIIVASAQQLAQQTHIDNVGVGVVGLSFAGGLALVAADDPQWSRSIAWVAAIGAHDDLARVVKFLITDSAPEPDGSTLHLQAHEYGALVAVYEHPEDFFAAQDVEAARRSLRLQLWEQSDAARQAAQSLSPAGKELMNALLAHDRRRILPEIAAEVNSRTAEMLQVSPAGHLGSIHIPVLLLHGAADSVIPPSETLWLTHDLPAGTVREVLISPAISHVEVKGPSFRDELRLVNWMAVLLKTADSSPKGKVANP